MYRTSVQNKKKISAIHISSDWDRIFHIQERERKRKICKATKLKLTLNICIIKWVKLLNLFGPFFELYRTVHERKSIISSIYCIVEHNPSTHIHFACTIKILRQLRYTDISYRPSDQLSFFVKMQMEWFLCGNV